MSQEKEIASLFEARIRKISEEIDRYRQAIRDAEGALEEAERELDEELDSRWQEGGNGYV